MVVSNSEKSSCQTWFGAVGSVRERGLAPLGERASFPLVVRGQDQSLLAQQPQDRRLTDHVPVVADDRPDLAVAPRRMRQRVLARQLQRGLTRWPRPRAPGPLALRGLGLPATPGPLGHVELLAELRGRHARLDADHLEVRKGPRRPSALFFQTRSSTAASPSAWVRGERYRTSFPLLGPGPDFLVRSFGLEIWRGRIMSPMPTHDAMRGQLPCPQYAKDTPSRITPGTAKRRYRGSRSILQ